MLSYRRHTPKTVHPQTDVARMKKDVIRAVRLKEPNPLVREHIILNLNRKMSKPQERIVVKRHYATYVENDFPN